ncbi:MAG: hypothetical protein Q9192_003719 [Flavoplaca navasiana]
MNFFRGASFQFTTLARWLAVWSVAGSVTSMAVSRPSRLVLAGRSSVPVSRPQPMNATWMIFARLINGWGTGILNAIVPVWATETAEHKSRGQFVAIEFTLNIFGVVVAYWLEYACSFYKRGNGSFIWRFPIAFQIVPLILIFAIVWLFPESPRWLVKVGREEEARYILGRLCGETGEDLGRAEAEFQDIRNIAELERKTVSRTSYRSLFTGRGSGKLHVGCRVQLVV